jgi:hypothetical protein
MVKTESTVQAKALDKGRPNDPMEDTQIVVSSGDESICRGVVRLEVCGSVVVCYAGDLVKAIATVTSDPFAVLWA